ncbi:hypothetical protein AVEN_153692-1 [Araneus ventricosus]|uniref:Uncharacterized protein n=1 Tax=Araneus ventricosus TaxID=182803 RepID=A0A4Y2G181_ARAVE|nr:hypothetical protein AVEN_153692-1 [Araneus ventricosus]
MTTELCTDWILTLVPWLLEVVLRTSFDLLSFRIWPVAQSPRQQSVQNVMWYPSIDSLAFDVRAFIDISPERSGHPKNPRVTTIPCLPTTADKAYFRQRTPSVKFLI